MPVSCFVQRGKPPRRPGLTAAVLAAVVLAALPLRALAEPPPGAPAHGYRAKAADGTTIIYDGVFGAYAVPGQTRTYWSEDRYYRNIEGVWMQSKLAGGPWELVPSAQVPATLRQGFPPPKERVSVTLPSGVGVKWEPTLRAYVITGHPGVFLVDARFLRYQDGVWLSSTTPEGPWEVASMKAFPVLLRSKAKPPESGARVTLPSGPELEYDSDLALFRVVGKPDTYFRDGTFYERRDKKWFRSTKADSGFEEIPFPKAPSALRAHYRQKEGGEPAGKQQAGAARKAKKDAATGGAAAGKKAGANPQKPQGAQKDQAVGQKQGDEAAKAKGPQGGAKRGEAKDDASESRPTRPRTAE